MPSTAQPDVVCGGEPTPQGRLPLAAEGVQRFVWRMAYGDILIEIHDGCAYVNGERVTPVSETLAPEQPNCQAVSSDHGEPGPTTRRGP